MEQPVDGFVLSEGSVLLVPGSLVVQCAHGELSVEIGKDSCGVSDDVDVCGFEQLGHPYHQVVKVINLGASVLIFSSIIFFCFLPLSTLDFVQNNFV